MVNLHLNVTVSFPSSPVWKLKSSVYGFLAYSQEFLGAFEGTKSGILVFSLLPTVPSPFLFLPSAFLVHLNLLRIRLDIAFPFLQPSSTEEDQRTGVFMFGLTEDMEEGSWT